MRNNQPLSQEQLGRFLTANGLRLTEGGFVVAPEEDLVGLIAGNRRGFYVVIFEESYHQEHCTIKAWWPSFRPAWIIFGGDEVDTGPILGPDEVICDFCNDTIISRPVPVVGYDALCPACFGGLGLRFPSRIKPYVPSLKEAK